MTPADRARNAQAALEALSDWRYLLRRRYRNPPREVSGLSQLSGLHVKLYLDCRTEVALWRL